MNNCTLDCIQIMGHDNFDQMCSFTQQYCIQDTIQFIQAYYCLFHGSLLILLLFGLPLFLLLFKILNVIAQNFLSQCVEEFISQLKISPTLAGVTFLAFANGSPDVMTAIVAGSSDSDTTALIPFGSIFGACLFSTAFISSTVIFLLPNQTLQVKSRNIIIPLLTYITGMIFIICVTIFYGKMNVILACVPLLLYLFFIIVVIRNQRKQSKKQSLIMSGQYDQDEQNKNKIQDSQIQKEIEEEEKQIQKGILPNINRSTQKILIFILQRIIPPSKRQKWNPINTTISLIVSPFILAATQQMPEIFKVFLGPIPVFLIICLPAIILLGYSVYCVVRQQQPFYITPYTIYSFLVSIACLTIICSILINFVELIQILTGINSVFLGLTVFAGANCIGDYMTISHFAKTGNSATAVSGIYSGQLFNFLIGFGVSLLIQSIDGEYEYKIFDFVGSVYDKISDAIVMCVILGGLIFLILTLITVKFQKGVFMRKQAIIARGYYVCFLAIACILAILTDFFYDIHCDMQ